MKRLLAALLALMMLLTMTSCAAPDATETDDKLTLVAFNVGKADALLLIGRHGLPHRHRNGGQLGGFVPRAGSPRRNAPDRRDCDAHGQDHYGGAKQLAESDIAIDGWYASWAWEKEKWKKHPW